MPRVIVMTDDKRQVLLDEPATLDRLEGGKPSGDQFIERLLWSISDAEDAQQAFREAVEPSDYRDVPTG